MFKINVDGDVFQATNGYGAGVIVWDYQGRLVEAFSVYKMGGTQSKVAKIICIKKALRWHEGKNVQGVVVETNYLVAFQALNNNVRMHSMFGLLVYDC
ncbi:hypothetical protein CsatA_017076 [Cannabis sativa]